MRFNATHTGDSRFHSLHMALHIFLGNGRREIIATQASRQAGKRVRAWNEFSDVPIGFKVRELITTGGTFDVRDSPR